MKKISCAFRAITGIALLIILFSAHQAFAWNAWFTNGNSWWSINSLNVTSPFSNPQNGTPTIGMNLQGSYPPVYTVLHLKITSCPPGATCSFPSSNAGMTFPSGEYVASVSYTQDQQIVSPYVSNVTQSGNLTVTVQTCDSWSSNTCWGASTAYPMTLSINVPPPNTPPHGTSGAGTGPNVTGPTTGIINTTYNFSATASDDQGNQIRYGFDWNMDGVVDTWVPASGYTNSGTSQTASYSWSTTGTHAFQVLAQDTAGANSPWTPYTITLFNSVPPTVSLSANPTLGTAPLNTTLSWSTTNNPTLCTATGGSSGWPGSKATGGSSQSFSNVAAGVYTYTLACGNIAGTSTASVVVQSDSAPHGSGGTGTGPTVTGPTTGYTNNTYTFTATATDDQNDQLRYGFDWNMDGVADTWVPANLSYVNSGTPQSASYSWSTTGTHTFQVLAQDAPGANSPWTQYQITTSNQVFPPTVSISASPSTMTLPNNSTRINWSTTNSPDTCTGTGGSANWPGSKATSAGFQDISGLTAGTYDFSITCSNSAGQASSNAHVVVNPALPTYSLNVTNTYGGTVKSADNYLACGTTCSHTYTQGDVVTLTAIPTSSQWTFAGWSGACTGTGSCTITMNAAKTVTALFTLHPLNYQEF